MEESGRKVRNLDRLDLAALQRRRVELEKETERLKKILKRAKSTVTRKHRSEDQGFPYRTRSQYNNQTDSTQNSFTNSTDLNQHSFSSVPQGKVCQFPSIHLVNIQTMESGFCLPTAEFGEMMNSRVCASAVSHRPDITMGTSHDVNTIKTQENVCSHSSIGNYKDTSSIVTSHQLCGKIPREDSNIDMTDGCDAKKNQRNERLPHVVITDDKCDDKTVGESVEQSSSHSRCLNLELFGRQFESQCYQSGDTVKRSSSKPLQDNEYQVESKVHRQLQPARQQMSFFVDDCATPVYECLQEEAAVSQESARDNHGGLFDVAVSLQHVVPVEAISCSSAKLLLCNRVTGKQEKDILVVAVSTMCHLVVWHRIAADNWQVLLTVALNKEEGEAIKQLSLVPVSSGVCVVAGGNLISCCVRVYRIVSFGNFSSLDVHSEESEVVDCQVLPTLESQSDLHSLQLVASSEMVIGTTSCCILVWNVSSCLLLNSVSLIDDVHVHIPVSIICLSAIYEKEVMYLTLVHTSSGCSGCSLVAYHVPGRVCTKLVDYTLCEELKGFTGVGMDTGRHIIAAMESQTVGVWDKEVDIPMTLLVAPVDITTTCYHMEEQLLLVGLADGNVLLIKLN